MAIKPPSPRYVGPAKWSGAANNKPINRIVIHCTVGTEPNVVGAAERVVAYSKGTTRPSSYHYIADSLHSLQFVFDSVVAYHAPPNQHSLGYELCCSLANEGKGHWVLDSHLDMLKIVAKDVAGLCLAYNVPIQKVGGRALKAGARGICGHNDVRDAWGQTSHWDPGPYFPWQQFINLVKAEADALTAPPRPAQPTGPMTRGDAVDRAIADLKKAIARIDKQTPRRRKLQAALESLRTIKPRRVK